MDIVLGSDRNFFHGLLTTVVSIVVHDRLHPLRIHILDGGLTPAQWETLSATVARLKSQATLIRHGFDQTQLSSFCNHGELSLMTYARVFIPYIIDAPFVVYVDADFLVTKAISGLLPYVNSDHALCGATDLEGDLAKDCPWGEGLDLSRYTYINCGLLIMNLEKWRKERISDTLITFLHSESSKCRFADQSAINWMLKDQIGILPQEWNTSFNAFDWGGAKPMPGTVNLHFASGMKPWKRPLPTASHKLWWLFTRRFTPKGSNAHPFLNPRNVLRYVRYRFQNSSPYQRDSLNAWKSFWEGFEKG
jgi:lipopolysaccharide biosynthesis glycosyltransferase